MDIERKSEDFKALSRVVPKVDLVDLFLSSCKVERALDALSYESIRANFSSSGGLLMDREDGFEAKVSLCLVLHSDDEQNKELLKIDSEYVLMYQLASGKRKPSSDDIEVFCDMNAVYNVWPFWREFVHNMATRMDLPLPIMPLLKFKPPKRKKKARPPAPNTD